MFGIDRLKADAIKPGHAGQLNIDLAAEDAQIKAPDDNPTIGLLLCKTRNHLVAEHALSFACPGNSSRHRQRRRRIAIATPGLPEPLDTCLPGIEQIEAELGRIREDEL